MSLQIIDEQGYETLMKTKKVAVVEFGATWCPPCKVLMPMLGELAEEYGDAVSIASVDCDESPELAAAFGIMSMPTVIVFRDGVPVDKLVGLRPKSTYRNVIDRYAGSPGA